MYRDFGAILVFILVGALFALGNLILNRILTTLGRARDPYPNKLSTYECGEEAIGTSWIQFNIRFYVIALVFIVFAVEVVILFPFVAVFRDAATGRALVEILVFAGLLVFGLAYDWTKGDLDWPKTLRGDIR